MIVGGGRRVLIVEDEAMIAMLLEDMLADLGYEVAAIAYSLESALKEAQAADIGLGVLDVNLNGKPSFHVAEILRMRGIPHLFATGYGTAGYGDAFAGAPILEKPFSQQQLAQAIGDALTRRAS